MLKAVIFDQDGVLVDTEKLQLNVWGDLLLKYRIRINKRMWKHNYQGRTTMAVLQDLFKNKFNNNKLTKIKEEKDRLLMKKFKANFKVIPGIYDFIRNLYNNNNIKVGVATSSNRKKAEFTTKKLGIQNYINVMVTCEDINKAKPDPEIYLTTANRLQVKPSNCLVFEDALLGIEAANRAGMKVILVKTSHQETELGKNSVIYAIKDFINFSFPNLLKVYFKKS